MKFNFKIQQYQTDAVQAAIDVFQGQPFSDHLTYMRDLGRHAVRKDYAGQQIQESVQTNMDVSEEEDFDLGYKNNEILLTDEELLDNIRTLQGRNNLHVSSELVRELGRCSLDIEMETGTGKTYVYIKTMFELNKRYGWSKFIVVVPSVAIREGVKKSFDDMADHFQQHYGKKASVYVYDSQNLNPIDDFSSSGNINVMIINRHAFAASLNEDKNVDGRKGDAAARIIYSPRDNFGSRRPIDVISANRPILILDEPQKLGGDVTQKAMRKFKPLFSLNYSATHAKEHNLIYVLDALEAFNQRLVKKIKVKGFDIKNLIGTNGYLCLEEIILSSNKPPRARMEIEIGCKNASPKRKSYIFDVGDELYAESNQMEQYKGYKISEIDPITETVTFINGVSIKARQVIGDVSEQDIRRIQIRETILSHFEKEEENFNQGIKTLSLFFIDEVAKYRQYDEDNNELLGEYGRMFEEEYQDVLNEYLTLENTPYQKYLRSTCSDIPKVHQGYFSIDKNHHIIDSKVKRGEEASDDISAYDLILKHKEQLLSFEEPTRFIFSHSALREGWDNPNVFQICTLKRSDSKTTKRQEVGRGLRLCVNQSGNRMDLESCGEAVHDINILTVIASESYKDFVSDLQHDIKKELYNRPIAASIEYFTGKTVHCNGIPVKLDAKQAKMIYKYLVKNDYIDDDDKITDNYRNDLADNTLAILPEEIKPVEHDVQKLIQAVFDDSVLNQMVSEDRPAKIQSNPLNDNFYKAEFQALWKEINHKYAYTVKINSDDLIKTSIAAIDDKLFVSEMKYTVTVGQQKETMNQYELERGDSFGDEKSRTQKLTRSKSSGVTYDLIGKIAEGTVLTRKTVASILKNIRLDKFELFKQNPEEFIAKVVNLIREEKAKTIVAQIKYNQVEGKYEDKIFVTQASSQDFTKAFHAKKAVQNYVFTDGTAEKSVERRFAESLDAAEEVCVYAKLPRGFHIPTPVGNYSPDWAIAFNEGMVKYVYFIAETKGSMKEEDRRPIENAKIKCAEKLFNDTSTSKVKYHAVTDYQCLLDVMDSIKAEKE